MKWFEKTASENDVVLSTRVRLARNLSDFVFTCKLEDTQKAQVMELIKTSLEQSRFSALEFLSADQMSQIDKIELAERHLISPEIISVNDGSYIAKSEDEEVSILVCNEDHVRIQCVNSGLQLEETFEVASELDSVIGEKLNYAFNEKLGYLTQCPTNLGTGMKASVFLHLPAVSITTGMPKLISTVAKLGLTLKPIYGGVSEHIGDIYQLSNQVTMGLSEEFAIKNLHSITSQIILQERSARESLKNDINLIDKIQRAFGIMTSAYMMSYREFIDLISLVRLGASLEILNFDFEKLIPLLITLKPATISASGENRLSAIERDILRAKMIKEVFYV